MVDYLDYIRTHLNLINEDNLLKSLCSDIILFGSVSRKENFPNDIDLAIKCFNYDKNKRNLISKKIKDILLNEKMYENNIFIDIVWLDRIQPDWICLDIKKDGGVPLIGNLDCIENMCEIYLENNKDHTL